MFNETKTKGAKSSAKVFLPLEVKMVIPWKVQLVGRWGVEQQIIDCQVKYKDIIYLILSTNPPGFSKWLHCC